MARFSTTRWSIFLRARGASPDAGSALDELCRIYRMPVLAYIRSRGYTGDSAEDLTQEFFEAFIAEAYHASADPARGRFRTFLLTVLKRFLINAEAGERRVKRGGRIQFRSLEYSLPEHGGTGSASETPESAFERCWALSIVDAALRRLRSEAERGGKLELFEALREFLVERPDESDYATTAARLGMRPNTLAVAVYRLRQRLRDLVYEELSHTAAAPDDLKNELRELRAALATVMN